MKEQRLREVKGREKGGETELERSRQQWRGGEWEGEGEGRSEMKEIEVRREDTIKGEKESEEKTLE